MQTETEYMVTITLSGPEGETVVQQFVVPATVRAWPALRRDDARTLVQVLSLHLRSTQAKVGWMQ